MEAGGRGSQSPLLSPCGIEAPKSPQPPKPQRQHVLRPQRCALAAVTGDNSAKGHSRNKTFRALSRTPLEVTALASVASVPEELGFPGLLRLLQGAASLEGLLGALTGDSARSSVPLEQAGDSARSSAPMEQGGDSARSSALLEQAGDSARSSAPMEQAGDSASARSSVPLEQAGDSARSSAPLEQAGDSASARSSAPLEQAGDSARSSVPLEQAGDSARSSALLEQAGDSASARSSVPLEQAGDSGSTEQGQHTSTPPQGLTSACPFHFAHLQPQNPANPSLSLACCHPGRCCGSGDEEDKPLSHRVPSWKPGHEEVICD
ncbi:uncharacterized protein LOC120761003 isoform X7 [Hirundo rustica]|uniref:uncharacterized protein LOC120761003 isoform X7 n=1 Tax=Hirundo rustica TaxID=43150 RepID=UPI002673BBAD|nr:uncharacterized protein LOC120761003 isoform X7 [Hirundo rustica]